MVRRNVATRAFYQPRSTSEGGAPRRPALEELRTDAPEEGARRIGAVWL